MPAKQPKPSKIILENEGELYEQMRQHCCFPYKMASYGKNTIGIGRGKGITQALWMLRANERQLQDADRMELSLIFCAAQAFFEQQAANRKAGK